MAKVDVTSKSDEICDCICHKKGSKVVHIVACCFKCPVCQQNIKTQFIENHSANCQSPKTKPSL